MNVVFVSLISDLFGITDLSVPFLVDLEETQRERCWQMLLEDSEAVFHLDTDGNVIATVHFNADEVRIKHSTSSSSISYVA